MTRLCPDCGAETRLIEGNGKYTEWHCRACKRGWVYDMGSVVGWWEFNTYTPIWEGCLEITDERPEV
jgi:transposase-like protein